MTYAKHHNINSIYATIKPRHKASTKLHEKAGFNVKNWKIASLRTGG